jgi:hypothetical protein
MEDRACSRCGRVAQTFVGDLCLDCATEDALALTSEVEAQAEARKGPLRRQLEAGAAEAGTMKAVTVLANQNDPYRVDTPAGHRDGEWLAMHADRLRLGDRKIHLRGLHYMFVSAGDVIKPNGAPYVNDDPNWVWLQDKAADSARWLRYVPFDQIIDKRNSEPIVRIFSPPEPEPFITVGAEVEIPEADEIEPRINVSGFNGTQPYKLVIFGEKSSLEPVLGPIADRYKADLYLMTGEISDTLLYQMARIGADDGRPMVVFTLSDCDPSGWQMPISIGRKLQGFKTLEFPDLSFEVRRVALTFTQAREYGLPSTPLKESERRADKWRRLTGVEQTEIDALAALNPDLLDRIVRKQIRPFYDSGLDARVREAREKWLDEAQAAFNKQADREEIDRIRDQAAAKLDTMRDEIEALNEALRVETGEDGDYELPKIVVPEARLNGSADGLPLLSSDWDWVTQTRRLITSKTTYREDDE